MKNELIIYIFILLLTTGCSTEYNSHTDCKPQPITFSAQLKSVQKQLSTARSEDTDLSKDGYSVVGYQSTVDFAVSGITSYNTIFPNVLIKNGTYSDVRYWSGNPIDRYSFYAYAPGNIPVNYTSNQTPFLSFKQENEPAKMKDLVIATPVLNNKSAQMAHPVKFIFYHAMSKIVVKFFNTKGTQLNNCATSVTYGNNTLKSKCNFNLDKTIGALDGNVAFIGESLPLVTNFIIPATALESTNAVEGGELLVPPQTVPSDFLNISLSYTLDGTTEPKIGVVGLPSSVLKSGMIITYNIDVSVESSSMKIGSVTLSNWDDITVPPIDWSGY